MSGPIEHVIISLDTVAAAFCDPVSQEPDDDSAMREIAFILTRTLRHVVERTFDHDQPILDSNGNTVGVITITRSTS
jgi:hypothetical protein